MTERSPSKAETLAHLAPRVTKSRILPQYVFTAATWQREPDRVLRDLATTFGGGRVIIRSSAADEDAARGSRAGAYVSVPDVLVDTPGALRDGIERVMASYGRRDASDQVLVQPMLASVAMSGVVFTRELDTLAPYYVFNYDTSGRTDAVTGGAPAIFATLVHSRVAPFPVREPRLRRVHEAVRELEELTGTDALDVEFAVAGDGEVVVFQVRPLAVAGDARVAAADGLVADCLRAIHVKVEAVGAPHPYLYGERSVFGVMPDWNPAEIIGVRPRRLALTLYRELVTDAIWAYQRNNYGYRSLRSFPLMVSFGGLPYVDVRVDFNSFIPADLHDDLARRLVGYYVDKLVRAPDSHDKVEFDVVFSCYTLDLPERLEALLQDGFTHWDLGELRSSLRRLTNRIIDPLAGLYPSDIARIKTLVERQARIVASELDPVAKVYWLLEDCKRYGTLPFAGLARAAFIAVQFLRSFVVLGILTLEDYDRCLRSLNTVAKQLGGDVHALRRGTLAREAFLVRYGHLRPGTYDIRSKRYDEAFDLYFSVDGGGHVAEEPGEFTFSAAQLQQVDRLLHEHGITVDANGLLTFMRQAIEGRESSKFVFSRSLSDALQILEQAGAALGFSDDDLSHLDISTVLRLYASLPLPDLKTVLEQDIAAGRAQYEITRRIRLPALIAASDDVYSFALHDGEPNFVTLARVAAETVEGAAITKANCHGRIVLMERADPGYDWIFAQRIAGLVTMYGGANSHMAIRAAELGIPAVIGCGEKAYGVWCRARVLEIDAANRQVRVLR